MDFTKIVLVVIFGLFLAGIVWALFLSGKLIDTGKNKENKKDKK
jgi:hypothetical protein